MYTFNIVVLNLWIFCKRKLCKSDDLKDNMYIGMIPSVPSLIICDLSQCNGGNNVIMFEIKNSQIEAFF